MTESRFAGVVSPADITVIIPVANRPDDLRRCLASVMSSTAAPREVIVVSDCAGADVYLAAKDAVGVRLIQLPFQVGPAAARNAGALAAKGTVLFFIDADVEVRPETIEQISSAMTANPHAAAIVGSYDDAPAAPGMVSQYRNLLNHFVHQHAPAEGFRFWGACGAIRKSAFTAVGGFEAGHRLEDVELGYRLRRAGYRIAMCPEIQVKHLKRSTFPSMIRADLFRRAAPWTRILLAYPDVPSTGLNVGWTHRFSAMLAAVTPLLLIDTIYWRPALSIALVTAALWMRLNASLIRFLAERRGHAFALRSIPLHWLHSILAGIGFLLGVVQHFACGTSAPGSASPLGSSDGLADESTVDLHRPL